MWSAATTKALLRTLERLATPVRNVRSVAPRASTNDQGGRFAATLASTLLSTDENTGALGDPYT